MRLQTFYRITLLLLLSGFGFLHAQNGGINGSGAAVAQRIIKGNGAPSSANCNNAQAVGKVYIRQDAGAVSASLYSCDNTGASTYAWEVYGSGGSSGCSAIGSPTANIVLMDNGSGCPADATNAATIPGLSVTGTGAINFGTQSSVTQVASATLSLTAGGIEQVRLANGGLRFGLGSVWFGRSLGAPDTGLSSPSAGVTSFDTTAAGNGLGSWKAFLGTITQTALGTTPADGAVLQNTTLSTSGATVQVSPDLHFGGHAWNTGGTPADNAMDCHWYLLPGSGNPIVGTMEFGCAVAGGAYGNVLGISNGGNLSISGSYQAGALTGAAFFWPNKAAILSPSDGIIEVSNNAITGFTRLQLGGTTTSFLGVGVTNQVNPVMLVRDATGGNTASLDAGLSSTITQTALANATATGNLLQNTTASTSGATVQSSPAQEFDSHVWNTSGTPADNFGRVRMWMQPTSSASPIATWRLDFSVDTGTPSFTNQFAFGSNGSMTAGTVFASGSFRAPFALYTDNALGTTTTDADLMTNNTASLVSGATVQVSPAINQSGTAWAVTAAASQAVDFRQYLLPVTATVPTGTEQFCFAINGGSYTCPMTLTSSGTLSVNGRINATSGSITIADIGAYQTQTRDSIFFPANGQLQIVNNAGTGAGIAASATGDVNACYNGTSFQVTFGAVCGTSLAIYKTDITPVAHGLDYIMQMRPVTFTWKDPAATHDLGMIADEVAAIDPLLGAYHENGELYNFRDRAVLATLVKAVQEQQAQINQLKGAQQ